LNVTSLSGGSGHYDVCSSANEYSTITASCSSGSVIQSIENSVYTDSNSPASCSNPDSAGFCNKYCDAANSCTGQNSCSFTVSNTNCGLPDPCEGIIKKLILKVLCNKTIINEDETGIATLSGLWNFNLGGHTLRIANPRVVTEAPVNAVLPDSTVLVLDFDEGEGNIVHDKSVYGNDGTLYNGSEVCSGGYCPTWIDGKFGNGLQLDGFGDYIDCGNDNSLDIKGDLTIELWIKLNEIKKQFFVEKGYDDNDNYGFHICNEPGCSLNGLSFEYRGNITSTLQHYCTGTEPFLQTNSWHHISAVVNDAHVSFYLDGMLIYNNIITEYPTTNTYNLFIGRQSAPWLSGNYGDFFNGTIDSVRVYNKALTPDETIILKPVSYD
jgi:hypothetical protein